MHTPSLVKIHWCLVKLSSGNEKMGMSRADNSVKNWRNLPISNPKPDLHNQYQCIYQVWWKSIDVYSSYHPETKNGRTDGRTYDGRTDGLTDDQRETIIPRYYCLAGYKNSTDEIMKLYFQEIRFYISWKLQVSLFAWNVHQFLFLGNIRQVSPMFCLFRECWSLTRDMFCFCFIGRKRFVNYIQLEAICQWLLLLFVWRRLIRRFHLFCFVSMLTLYVLPLLCVGVGFLLWLYVVDVSFES